MRPTPCVRACVRTCAERVRVRVCAGGGGAGGVRVCGCVEPYDYRGVGALSTEEVEILNTRQPPTLGVASRTRGIRPSSLLPLLRLARLTRDALAREARQDAGEARARVGAGGAGEGAGSAPGSGRKRQAMEER